MEKLKEDEPEWGGVPHNKTRNGDWKLETYGNNLWLLNIAMEAMIHRNRRFTVLNSMVIFHGYVSHNQRVYVMGSYVTIMERHWGYEKPDFFGPQPVLVAEKTDSQDLLLIIISSTIMDKLNTR